MEKDDFMNRVVALANTLGINSLRLRAHLTERETIIFSADNNSAELIQEKFALRIENTPLTYLIDGYFILTYHKLVGIKKVIYLYVSEDEAAIIKMADNLYNEHLFIFN